MLVCLPDGLWSSRYDKLKEDFKFNLGLIEDRDAELGRYEAAVQGLKESLRDKVRVFSVGFCCTFGSSSRGSGSGCCCLLLLLLLLLPLLFLFPAAVTGVMYVAGGPGFD